jgi:hypothetical protein
VLLQDHRGTLISLSHYCPTAAELVLAALPDAVRMVPAPPGLVNGAHEGFDATGALPPLLRPGLLMDLDAYAEWERLAMETLARREDEVEMALAAIDAATREIEQWRPGRGIMREVVERAFDRVSADRFGRSARDWQRVRLAYASVPAGLTPPVLPLRIEEGWLRVSDWWGTFDAAVRRYLAAKLFGNWIAYSGQGLRTIVEWLRVCLAVLESEVVRQQLDGPHQSQRRHVLEAIRASDLLMVHLSDHTALAQTIDRIVYSPSA